MRGISNETLQAHLHEIGLEEFLKQLNDVFAQAETDTKDFDIRAIPVNYNRARWGVNSLRHRIFKPVKTRHEMEKFVILIASADLAFTEESIIKRVKAMTDEDLKKKYDKLSWMFSEN